MDSGSTRGGKGPGGAPLCKYVLCKSRIMHIMWESESGGKMPRRRSVARSGPPHPLTFPLGFAQAGESNYLTALRCLTLALSKVFLFLPRLQGCPNDSQVFPRAMEHRLQPIIAFKCF